MLPAALAGTGDTALSEGHVKSSVSTCHTHNASKSRPHLSSELSIPYRVQSCGRATVPEQGRELGYIRDRELK
jgi:hypothetical protein